MWIQWRYNDHGAGGFKELEVPNDVVKTYGSVEDYICELGLVPTHSERFMMGRIKVEKLKKPSQEFLKEKIKDFKATIKWKRAQVKQYQALLD